jgi:hypothetical protein
MKKLSSVLALLAVVGMVLVSGCKPADNPPPPPVEKGTNAPAAP